jgi:PleD family two-component response regulator
MVPTAPPAAANGSAPAVALRRAPNFVIAERNLLWLPRAHGASASPFDGVEMQIGVESSKAVDQRRVFVIDDDEIVRAALQFMLHDEIETHELATPEEAYDKASDWLKPDLVLLGASFLKERGTELVGELAKAFPRVRILTVCDKADEKTAVEAIKAGAHGAIVKPLSIEAVRKKVDTVLGRGGAAPLVQLGALK